MTSNDQGWQSGCALVSDALARAAVEHADFRGRLELLRASRLADVSLPPALRRSEAETRDPVRLLTDARAARAAFKAELDELVQYLGRSGASRTRAVEHVRQVLAALRLARVLRDDGGAIEAEAVEWVIEGYRDHARDVASAIPAAEQQVGALSPRERRIQARHTRDRDARVLPMPVKPDERVG